MRIAFVSDIHGNLPALDAVLADIRARAVDSVVNCGDILSGPLWPAETAARLMPLGWPTIQGNHERWLLACAHAQGAPADRFAYDSTSAAQREWLAGLSATLRLGAHVFVCHGTPAHDTQYLLETLTAAGSRLATIDEINSRLKEGSTAGSGDACASGIELILCGHSHVARTCLLPDGRLIVNPGSVGLPAYFDDYVHAHVHEAGSPHARYAICERAASGEWTVVHHAVAYDWHAASRRAREQGSLDWAAWLATGRAA